MTDNYARYITLATKHTEKEIASILNVGERSIRRYAFKTGVRPKANKYREKTNVEWLELFNQTYQGSLSIEHVERDHYGRPTADITCLLCGVIWQARLSDKLTNETGCIVCDKGNYGNRYTAEQVTDFLNEQHANQWELVVYGKYSQKNSTIKCLLCKNVQVVNLADMINTTSQRCTNCQTGSFGEYIIRNTLRFNEIPFESEVRIDVGHNRYRLDFLIDNTIALEYSGLQHFEPGRYFNHAVNQGVIAKEQWAIDNDFVFHEIIAKRKMADIIGDLGSVLGQALATPTPEFFATSDEAMVTVLNHMSTHSARQTCRDLQIPITKIQKYVQLAGYKSISAWQGENQRTHQ